ncbi:hypothetical protein DPMN_169799 [Dreissena polymorpha]|uniref:Uncharacterized protein n=1 Tax=Dreissena polymorpha TaxID=45954 RepID=A0A9D4DWP1_DREPO|nr:hypothetical protein DPMN_169799 [Dreissena polymorpha]
MASAAKQRRKSKQDALIEKTVAAVLEALSTRGVISTVPEVAAAPVTTSPTLRNPTISVPVPTAHKQNVVPTTLPCFADASTAYTDPEKMPVTLPGTSALPTNSLFVEEIGIGTK